jgi:hypothetical protein
VKVVSSRFILKPLIAKEISAALPDEAITACADDASLLEVDRVCSSDM